MLSKKENLKLLGKRIAELNLKGNIVIAFDFDELVVPIHLTREITRKVSKPLDKEALDKYVPCSFEEIYYLNSLIWGYDVKKYEKIRDNFAKKTGLAKGFGALIKELSKRYSVIFISSGMKDICMAKLKEIGFDPRNVLADEFKFGDDKIIGTDLIISDELKGYIIRKLKKSFRVIAIGHSMGDKTMLDESDISISFNSNIPNLAKYNVKTADELLEVIEKHKD